MQDNQQQNETIIERRGAVGIIRLNRPKALNSLTLGMVRAISAALDDFAADPAIVSVVVQGEGERGFCAGGDIRAFYESGKAQDGGAEIFLREEFRLNHQISRYRKPYVALMDGITMGGGVGISSHGRHRVVTERTRFAMPETGIGYFPDVGSTWLLPRTPGESGTWLGLTGLDVAAADVLYAGLADFQISSFRLPQIIEVLSTLQRASTSADVDAVLRNLSERPGESRLQANAAVIDRSFVFNSVEEIMAALAREEGEFARETLRVLLTRSPTSLTLALRLLRLGRQSRTLAECLNREVAAVTQILQTPDFYEGIRAAVIDKDRNPQWAPATIAALDPQVIEPFFKQPEPPLAL